MSRERGAMTHARAGNPASRAQGAQGMREPKREPQGAQGTQKRREPTYSGGSPVGAQGMREPKPETKEVPKGVTGLNFFLFCRTGVTAL